MKEKEITRNTVVLALSGEQPEKVINMAISRGIPLWHLYEQVSGGWHFETTVAGVRPIFRLARQKGCRVKILARKGPAFLWSKIKRRRSFAFGCLFFMLALFIANHFIWFVDIQCPDPYLALKAQELIGQYGLTPGSLKSAVHVDEVRENLLQTLPELSFVGIEAEGSRLTVELVVRMKQEAPTMKGRGDLVATADGIIEEILVLQGTALVQPGDRVYKGQVLIAGYQPLTQAEWAAHWRNSQREAARREQAGLPPVSDSSDEEELAARRGISLLTAQGVVRAKVQREIAAQSALLEDIYVDTGAETTWYQLKIQEQSWRLSGLPQPPYERYRQIINIKTLWQNQKRGITVQLIGVTSKEQHLTVIERSLQQAAAAGVNAARAQLAEVAAADFRILQEEVRPGQEAAGVVKIILAVETLEDIGAYGVSTAPG